MTNDMGYRFQKITTTDYSYLQPFLAQYPHYKQLSYREFYDLCVSKLLPHASEEIIPNCGMIQRHQFGIL